jgi:hypothetical protein
MMRVGKWLAGAALIFAAICAVAYVGSLAETAYFERSFEP